MTEILPATEAAALAEYEQAVERGLSTFLDVGRALLAIRDGRLYRSGHDTFAAYCQARWGMSVRHAERMVQAAEVAEVMRPIGRIENEAQARELAPLLNDPDALQSAWQQAQEATGGKPTAAAIRNIVRPPALEPDPAAPGVVKVATTAEEFVAQRDTREVLSVEEWQRQEQAAQDAEITEQLHASLDDTDNRFLLNLLRGITGTNSNLLALDPTRAVEVCANHSDERDSLLAFLDRVQEWSDAVRTGLRPSLRRIK